MSSDVFTFGSGRNAAIHQIWPKSGSGQIQARLQISVEFSKMPQKVRNWWYRNQQSMAHNYSRYL